MRWCEERIKSEAATIFWTLVFSSNRRCHRFISARAEKLFHAHSLTAKKKGFYSRNPHNACRHPPPRREGLLTHALLACGRSSVGSPSLFNPFWKNLGGLIPLWRQSALLAWQPNPYTRTASKLRAGPFSQTDVKDGARSVSAGDKKTEDSQVDQKQTNTAKRQFLLQQEITSLLQSLDCFGKTQRTPSGSRLPKINMS